MKILSFLIALLLLSCAPTGTVELTPAQLAQESTTTQPLDTLAAYRKYPGQPKTVHVKEYTRTDGSVVKEHYRSERN